VENLLLPVFTSILAIFIAVFDVVFVFLQQWWFQLGYCDSQQQKEKLVILPPSWSARPAAWLAFA
jgi:hypothetical protein